MKRYFSVFMMLLSSGLWAQNPIEPDSIALAQDKFQDYFYEALKQKGIENYDRAISNLQSALQLQPKETTILHEIAKNYLYQKKYVEAEDYFNRALHIEPNNKWFLTGLYDVYYQSRNYDKSIIVVKKLIPFDDAYKEDLVSLYMYTQQHDKALELIEDLDATTPKSQKREMYKLQILSNRKQDVSQIDELEALLKKNPKSEQTYISLIYLYSENNQEVKAFETAKLFEKNIPSSDWSHVSLFKFYLNENQVDKSVVSMNRVIKSNQIDNKIKHRVINEFLIFVNANPKYDKELEKAVLNFKSEKEIQVAKEIAKFYFNKSNWQETIDFLEISLDKNPDDLESALLLLEAYNQSGNFSVLDKKSSEYLDLYPLQSELYYYAGMAKYKINDFNKSKVLLQEGLDYVVDNKELEYKFLNQLYLTFLALNNSTEANKYLNKAEKLKSLMK